MSNKSKKVERKTLRKEALQKRSVEHLSSLFNAEFEAKAKAAATDPAWANAGKQEGLQVWRVENFTVKEWPKDKYGQFFCGDSYIVLKTFPGKRFDVHFWLGDTTSQDEAGTAAYKTVELDTLLGGVPVQHREVQGSESDLFNSYFPQGIRILSGGVESGFNHVEPTKYRPRLLHIKGNMKATKVIEEDLDGNSLRSDDVFLLDNGLEVFQWNGKKADPGERMKGTQIIQNLQSERCGKVKSVVLEEGEEEPRFWEIIGSRPSSIESRPHKTRAVREKALFRLSDASGKLTFTEVARGAAVKRDALKSEDVFILDNGREVFAWVGSKTSPQEKRKALQYAEGYLKDKNIGLHSPISRVVEGHENDVFLGSF